MGVLDGPMAKVANTLVGTFGRAATFKDYPEPTYRVPTGTAITTPTDISCKVSVQEFHDSQIDGTLIKRGDRLFIVARSDLGVEPAANRDEIVVDGKTWSIVGVKGLSSGEQEAAYELHVRL